MGTRNLTMVFKDGDYKLAQYGQWDGYPEDSGLTVLTFLRDKMDRELFLANLGKCTAITFEDVQARFDKTKDGFEGAFPSLCRNIGAGILELVQSTPDGLYIVIDTNFAADSLICEWAYVIDFDTNRLEAFKGFNRSNLGPDDRFRDVPLPARCGDFRQVKIAGSWPLDALPTNAAFLAELDEDAAQPTEGETNE